MLALVALLACGQPEPLPEHTLAFGGDVLLGRQLNLVLYDEQARSEVLDAITPQLAGADLALVNAEGVIAAGGAFADKGEPRPHMYRAHPNALGLLADAGVDLLATGNNHSGDYGPDALREMLERTLQAGLDYAGAGTGPADARRAAYRRVGDTVLAVVGADLTIASRYGARRGQPGIFHLPGLKPQKVDKVVAGLSKALDEAREHAHVVLLSPHWGDNFEGQPKPHIRELARRLIDAGYDGILGHSAHQVQGLELVDGKPVLYDAGNLLVDYGGTDASHRSLLFTLSFSRAGVTGIEALPLKLTKNRTEPAAGALATRILDDFAALSSELGTAVELSDGLARVQLDPGSVTEPTGTVGAVRRPVPDELTLAPADLVVDALPAWALPTEVRWPGGVRLDGYHLLLDELPVPKAGQIISLFLRGEADLPEVMIRLEARVEAGGRGTRRALHLPGDWLLPSSDWPTTGWVHDRTLMRLTLEPQGTVGFWLGLELDGAIVPPEASALEQDARGYVRLGEATYVDGAPRLFKALETWEAGLAVTPPDSAG